MTSVVTVDLISSTEIAMPTRIARHWKRGVKGAEDAVGNSSLSRCIEERFALFLLNRELLVGFQPFAILLPFTKCRGHVSLHSSATE